jgi:hypothetical protein
MVSRPDDRRRADTDEIMRLKARYFRLMDEREWATWGDVLTEECVMTLGGDPPVVLEGRDAIVASAQRNLDGRVGVHLGHMPEIDITGDGTATGRWVLLAYSAETPPAGQTAHAGMLSFGRYEDRYERGEDGAWRIARTTLSTVLRVVDDVAAAAVLHPTDGVVVVA